MKIKVMTPGTYRVSFVFVEKKGSRNVKASGMIIAMDTTAEGASRHATERRGHLTKFVIVSVEQDYETREMTRNEEFDAAQKSFAALVAKRGTTPAT